MSVAICPSLSRQVINRFQPVGRTPRKPVQFIVPADAPVVTDPAGARLPGYWLAWAVPPIVLILLVAVAVAWLGHWEFSRTSYWATQRDTFLALNSILSALPPEFWSNLNELGKGDALLLLAAPLLIWFPRSWAAMLGTVPIAEALTATSKHFAAIPRPASVLDPQQFTVIGDMLTSSHSSFPSGHSMAAFAAAVALLASIVARPVGWRDWLLVCALLVVASLISLSRIAVGAHWPLDLPAGAAIGWTAGLGGAMLARHYPGWWSWSQHPGGHRVLGIAVLFASVLLLYSSRGAAYGAVTLWLAVLCGAATSLRLIVGEASVLPGDAATRPS